MWKKILQSSAQVISMLVIGIGVGFLIGLSLSPVLHIIVGSLITLVVSIAGILVGIEFKHENLTSKSENSPPLASIAQIRKGAKISLAPLAIMIVGLAVGSAVGICARTNEWFGVNPDKLFLKWKGTGLEEKQVKRRFFDQTYPPATSLQINSEGGKKDQDEREKPSVSDAKPAKPASQLAGLFGLSVDQCAPLLLKDGDKLKAELKMLNNRRVDLAVEKCQSDECLKGVVNLICSED